MESTTQHATRIAGDDTGLLEDLERYRAGAIELGATDAKVIRAEDIVVDERVRGKCRYPTCPSYNTNMNCPPHTMGLDEFRTLLGKYRYGILFKIDVTSGSMDDFKVANRRTLMNILWRTESAAFYDGHYFATGFGGTNCKDIFCPKLECAALAGKGCRNEFKARPGMHGMGIDVFATAARVGWTLYPAGSSCDLTTLPHLSSVGLVLID